MSWTDERTEILRTMWAAGSSGGDIARVLGTTRNAVIGKVHRLELPGRDLSRATRSYNGKRVTQARRRKQRNKSGKLYTFASGDPKLLPPWLLPDEYAASAKEAFADARDVPDLVVPEAERRTLDDLEAGDCRWPMGDPRTKEFHFCNRLKVGTTSRFRSGVLPYCEFHARRAYQLPMPGQRDRYRVSLITGLTIRKLEPANEQVQAQPEKEIA
jgi:GcrA cell cycle regulator